MNPVCEGGLLVFIFLAAAAVVVAFMTADARASTLVAYDGDRSNATTIALFNTSAAPNEPVDFALPKGMPPGEWVYVGDRYDELDPPCCSWDENSSPECSSLNSEWDGNNGLFMNAGGHSCSCRADRLRNIPQFEWTPRDYSLPAWNASAFCDTLGRRTILFIGDSQNTEVSAGIHNYIVRGGGGCAHQLRSRSSDELVEKDFGGGWHRGLTWDNHVRTFPSPPDIVIIAAGAHLRRGSAGVLELLGEVREEYDRDFGSAQMRLVWRTSIGGGCLREGSPLVPMTTAPKDTLGYWDAVNQYNFREMEEWDDLAVEFWAQCIVDLECSRLHHFRWPGWKRGQDRNESTCTR